MQELREEEEPPPLAAAPLPPAAASGLTPRALVLGAAIGLLLCFSNTFFGLQTGWVTMASLQSALLAFLCVALAARADPARAAPLSIAEHVLVVTVSTASATMPLAAGFVLTGVLAMVGATIQYRRELRRLHHNDYVYRDKPQLAAATAVLITLIGVVALLLVAFGAGP